MGERIFSFSYVMFMHQPLNITNVYFPEPYMENLFCRDYLRHPQANPQFRLYLHGLICPHLPKIELWRSYGSHTGPSVHLKRNGAPIQVSTGNGFNPLKGSGGGQSPTGCALGYVRGCFSRSPALYLSIIVVVRANAIQHSISDVYSYVSLVNEGLYTQEFPNI